MAYRHEVTYRLDVDDLKLRRCSWRWGRAVGFVLLMLSVPASAAEPKPKSESLYNPLADPAADLRAATAKAQKQGKYVLLEVGGNWCKWCHRLEKFLAANADVAAAWHRNFVVVRVSVDGTNDNAKFLSSYPKFKGVPFLYVLDATGKLLQSQSTGELEKGSTYDHQKVMAFLDRWRPPTPNSR